MPSTHNCLLMTLFCIFQLYETNHWFNSEGKKQTLKHETALLYERWWSWQYELSFVLTHLVSNHRLCECPRRRSYQWMYDWVRSLFACFSWVEAVEPLILWGPLYDNGGKVFFLWILQSKTAWMPWNVHYFLSETVYSIFFYLTKHFAISTLNILITDMDLAHVRGAVGQTLCPRVRELSKRLSL